MTNWQSSMESVQYMRVYGNECECEFVVCAQHKSQLSFIEFQPIFKRTKWQTFHERRASQWWRQMSWDFHSEDSSRTMKELWEEWSWCLIWWKHASVFTLFSAFGLISEVIWNHTNLRPDLSKQNLHRISRAVLYCMNESWFCFTLKQACQEVRQKDHNVKKTCISDLYAKKKKNPAVGWWSIYDLSL